MRRDCEATCPSFPYFSRPFRSREMQLFYAVVDATGIAAVLPSVATGYGKSCRTAPSLQDSRLPVQPVSRGHCRSCRHAVHSCIPDGRFEPGLNWNNQAGRNLEPPGMYKRTMPRFRARHSTCLFDPRPEIELQGTNPGSPRRCAMEIPLRIAIDPFQLLSKRFLEIFSFHGSCG